MLQAVFLLRIHSGRIVICPLHPSTAEIGSYYSSNKEASSQIRQYNQLSFEKNKKFISSSLYGQVLKSKWQIEYFFLHNILNKEIITYNL